MPQVRNLYDALIKPAKAEDKCTNFLVWLFEKLPPEIVNGLCHEVGLSFTASEFLHTTVQYVFPDSRPDAVFESNYSYLILETKLYPNRFDRQQFVNHIAGAIDVFGRGNVCFLFLSSDDYQPNDIIVLKRKYPNQVAFVSWKNLLRILLDSSKTSSRQYEIIIREFLLLANHYKLGRLISMNPNELVQFIDSYSKVTLQRDSVTQLLLKFMKQELTKRIIAQSGERAELADDDSQEELPCFYFTFNVKGWHTTESAYLFLNIPDKTIGVLLTGYQSSAKEKKLFIERWDNKLKDLFAQDKDLATYTWIDENDDDAIDGLGYFRQVSGVSGEVFNPLKIDALAEYFYWGYSYSFDTGKFEDYYKTIPEAFSRLLNVFASDVEKPISNRKRKTRK